MGEPSGLDIKPWNVVRSLINLFPLEARRDDETCNAAETDLAIEIHSYICSKVRHTSNRVDINEAGLDLLPSPADTSHVSSDTESDFSSVVTNKPGKAEDVNLSYKKAAVDYWNNDEGKRQSFECVKNRFRRLKHKAELYRWEKQINEEGTKMAKSNYVTRETLKLFKSARNQQKLIHDDDIRKWAMEAARRVEFSSFNASHSWIVNFKKKNRIVSRKVTKFVTRQTIVNSDAIRESADVFVKNIRVYVEEYGCDRVYNSDQSGFNLEFHSGRTLNNCGEKKVFGDAQSINSLSHSYTIQPTISANGRLMPVCLVVLQEKGGSFGVNVKKTLYTADNLYVVASKSGKLSNELVEEWLKNVFLPNIQDNKCLLLLDSWSGQSEKKVSSVCNTEEKQVIVKTIPKGTTGLIQPLDVFGFRVWKNFVRTFYDKIILHDLDVSIHLRNNILRIQSYVHNQLSSPRFYNMWRYSLFKAGYLTERPPKFENPVPFCFRNPTMAANCSLCETPPVLICSWCKKSLCLGHFFTEIHLCNSYIP